jgi:BED zinc finger
MEEEIETLSERTLSSDELNFNQIEPEREWVDEIIPDESASQITCDTELTNLEISASAITGSTVWLYFDKIPPHALGYNVCKKCNKKFSITTGVTTLRGHLKMHQLKAPTKKQTVSTKHKNPFDDEQTNTMNTLFSGLFVISNNSQSSITIILESF